MKLTIELRKLGIESLIGKLIERLIKRLIERCNILSAGIVHSCYRSVLGSVDSRRVKEGISIKVSSFIYLILKPSFAAPLVIP
jgi:xanthosine utilization system XapX-like protein